MSLLYVLLFQIPCAFLLRYAMEKLIPISAKRWKRLLMLFSFFIFSGMVIFIGDMFNIVFTILFFLFTVFICCKGSLWQKAAIGLMFASTLFSFNALRDNYLTGIHMRFWSRSNALLITGLASLLFSLFLSYGVTKFAPDRDYTLSEHMWKLLLLLTATPIGIVLSVVLLYDYRNELNYDYTFIYRHCEYAVLLIIALLSFIGLLWAVTVLAKQQKLTQQNMLSDINRNYYKAMEQQYFEIRRLKHDMANHLQVLSALPDDERDTYLQKLSAHNAFTKTLHYCNDSTVNAVLSVKISLMERYGIHLQYTLEITEELPYDKTDVCALFANALDNAIEACMEACMESDADRREIILESKAQKGLFCLKVQNPSAPSHHMNLLGQNKPAVPPTSKSDKENHGLGLKSMQEIVIRHHGTLEWHITDGMFELFLYMPLYDI